jgi:hypothetical protein
MQKIGIMGAEMNNNVPENAKVITSSTGNTMDLANKCDTR